MTACKKPSRRGSRDSAGGVYSPAVLLRSGIGPADDLRKHGIAVVADRRGVDARYPKSPADAFLHAAQAGHTAHAGFGATHHDHVGFIRLAGLQPGDLFHYYTGRVSTRSFGPRMAMIAACLYTPVSRGFVALRSADPNDPPVVEQRLLADPLDAKRMIIIGPANGATHDAGAPV